MIKAYQKIGYLSFRKCRWLIQLNKLLSQEKACYDFWRNIIDAKNELNFLTTPRDNVFLFDSSCSFTWKKAKFPKKQDDEKFEFWFIICTKIVKYFNDNNYCGCSKE